jgi:hypothetical protein
MMVSEETKLELSCIWGPLALGGNAGYRCRGTASLAVLETFVHAGGDKIPPRGDGANPDSACGLDRVCRALGNAGFAGFRRPMGPRNAKCRVACAERRN